MSSFEHINFAINEKYSQKYYDNPNYYASLVIFQTYKNVILKNVHSLEWLFWLCFYPLAFAFNNFSFFIFSGAFLSKNRDNQLIPSKLCFINHCHFYFFNVIVNVNWVNKMTRLEVGGQIISWGFDHFECVLSNWINFWCVICDLLMYYGFTFIYFFSMCNFKLWNGERFLGKLAKTLMFTRKLSQNLKSL